MSQPTASKPNQPVVIRPSIRLVKAYYYVVFALIALYFFLTNNEKMPEGVNYLIVIPAVLLAWTVIKHLRLRFVTLTVVGNKLRYETGFLSKTTRTMELGKVQDVGVSQTVTQRLLGVGDISVETAGDSAPLRMQNVERPQAIADFILESART